ncbi:hypothetical protein D7147_24090 [Micromonospora musae]|uniref:Uncharacterized protein n=1 Tax=Micromonospora musae TaxID=1894970 RepID=A0A3A9YGQ0_9ACTN|nr:hypothetical protein [Micromonospora musae]RKN16170.1 hypothetical protein D7147_24090 [Micromonospora musae]RKN36152.1 hypothetical protein D7044_00360 [Micromonospora musae]
MSYDITFLSKDDDQSWDQALDALEERVEDDADTGSPDAEAWAHIVAEARQLLGDVDAQLLQLDHEPTGIQLSLYGDEAGITVPYWYQGPDAAAIVKLIYQLGLIVERHTRLVGYDGQVGLAVAEAADQPHLAVSIFDQVARSFARRGIASPSNN